MAKHTDEEKALECYFTVQCCNHIRSIPRMLTRRFCTHTHTHTPITSSSPSHHRNTDRDVQVYMSIFEDLKRKILKSEMKSLKLWEICFCLFVFLPRTSQ